MKHLLVLIACGFAFTLGGCAKNGPTAEQVQDQFRRGLAGEGRLGPIDRSDDPYVRPRGSGSVRP